MYYASRHEIVRYGLLSVLEQEDLLQQLRQAKYYFATEAQRDGSRRLEVRNMDGVRFANQAVDNIIHNREDSTPMSKTSQKIREADQALIAARARLLEAEMALEDAKKADIPDESKAGSYIAFSKQFTEFGRTYSYAAVKANGRWFITGSSGRADGYSWRQLIEFIRADYRFGNIDVLVQGPTILSNGEGEAFPMNQPF